MDFEGLLSAARDVRSHAFAPYSSFIELQAEFLRLAEKYVNLNHWDTAAAEGLALEASVKWAYTHDLRPMQGIKDRTYRNKAIGLAIPLPADYRRMIWDEFREAGISSIRDDGFYQRWKVDQRRSGSILPDINWRVGEQILRL